MGSVQQDTRTPWEVLVLALLLTTVVVVVDVDDDDDEDDGLVPIVSDRRANNDQQPLEPLQTQAQASQKNVFHLWLELVVLTS